MSGAQDQIIIQINNSERTDMSSQQATSPKQSEYSQFTIFVGSLSEKTTQANVFRYFSKFGLIQAANLITDWTTGTSKRCAIVFCSTRDTYCSILGCSKHILDGKKIRVAMADQDKKGTKKISTNNLFVGNIPSTAQDKLLLDLFSQFGPIAGMRFFKNASTKPNTKNCIIEYHTSGAVEQAFKNKAYLNIDGQALKISPLKQKRTQNEGGCHQADQGEQFLEEEGCFAWESNNNAYLAETNEFQAWNNEPVSRLHQASQGYFDYSVNTTGLPETYSGELAEEMQLKQETQDFEVETPGISSEMSLTGEEEEDSVLEKDMSLRHQFVTLIDIYGDDDLAVAFFKDSPSRKERINRIHEFQQVVTY